MLYFITYLEWEVANKLATRETPCNMSARSMNVGDNLMLPNCKANTHIFKLQFINLITIAISLIFISFEIDICNTLKSNGSWTKNEQ